MKTNNGLKEIKYIFICPSSMNINKLIHLPEDNYFIDTTLSENNEHLVIIREKNDDINKDEKITFFEKPLKKTPELE